MSLLLDKRRPLCILSKEVGHCSNRHVPLWQTLNDVTYCQQLVTDQAGRWAAVTAISWWCCHWMAEDILILWHNALDNNNCMLLQCSTSTNKIKSNHSLTHIKYSPLSLSSFSFFSRKALTAADWTPFVIFVSFFGGANFPESPGFVTLNCNGQHVTISHNPTPSLDLHHFSNNRVTMT